MICWICLVKYQTINNLVLNFCFPTTIYLAIIRLQLLFFGEQRLLNAWHNQLDHAPFACLNISLIYLLMFLGVIQIYVLHILWLSLENDLTNLANIIVLSLLT